MRLAWKHSEGAGYTGGFYFLSCVTQSRRGRRKFFSKAKNKKGYVQKAHILLKDVLLEVYLATIHTFRAINV